MGGQKSFYTCWGGFKKFWRLAKGGSKKIDAENFQLPSPPHQSIYEHSLSSQVIDKISIFPKITPNSTYTYKNRNFKSMIGKR